MSKKILIFISGLLAFSVVLSVPFDSGWREWRQPNGLKFTARYWGDEFQWWMRTEDGYSIIKGSDGYFYYAVLDSSGEFTASNDTVGINPPLTDSYQLERSIDRQAEIDAEIAAFNEQLILNHQWYMNKLANGDSTLKVGVLLVDFTPSERNPNNINNPLYPNPYPKHYFDSLYFSTDYWYDENPAVNQISPDGEYLFGSFRDYFRQQSLEKLDIIGTHSDERQIINPDTLNGIPNWLVLGKSKKYYTDSTDFDTFINDAFIKLNEKILNNGWNPQDTVDIDVWTLIYAGENDMNGGLRIHGGFNTALQIYSVFMSELWRNETNDPTSSIGFSHIGVTCHEFGHVLGAADEYGDTYLYPADPDRWDIMSGGRYPGPFSNKIEGACPAGFSPPYRVEFFEWVPAVTIQDTTNLTLHYDYFNPEYYKIDNPGSEEYFIIENRLREGFDKFTPISDTSGYNPGPNDPNGAIGGLLIWHADSSQFINYRESSDFIELEFANNDPYYYSPRGIAPEGFYDFYAHPFPYGSNDQSFNDMTLPAARKRNGSFSGVAINNIQWNENDSSITIEEISHNYNLDVITENQTWSGIHSINKNTLIDSGVTITVNTGTVIEIDETLEIIFSPESYFNPQGTPEQPVTFQAAVSQPPYDYWKGIQFQLNDNQNIQLDLNHINIQESENGFTFSPGLGISQSSTIKLDSLHFKSNLRSMRVKTGYLSTPVEISNCYFENSPLIISETFPISLLQNLVLRNNVFEFPGDTAIKYTTHELAQHQILNNLFLHNASGIFIADSITSGLSIRNNIFAENESGISYSGDTTNLEVEYNGFWNNGNPISGIKGDSAVIADPLFVYEEEGNYGLTWNSPLVDAGDPDYDDDGYTYHTDPDDQDPDGTRMDIGPFYYHQHQDTIFSEHISNWNFVGLPIGEDSAYYLDIFPSATPGTFFRFEGTYIQDSILVPGEGYSLRFDTSGSDTINGIELTALSVNLETDWNLFSGISSDYPVNNIIDPSGIIIPNTIFGFDGVYYSTDTLKPAQGYWIRASDSGNITLSKGYDPIEATQFVDLMEGANWIEFTNAAENKVTLYFGVSVPANEQLSYSMPPLPPDSLLDSTALDARFTGDWLYTDSTAQIVITNHSYPLTVEYCIVNGDTGDWNLSNFGLTKSGSGVNNTLPSIHHTLKSKGRIIISQPVKSLLLGKSSRKNIPKKFALYQNYPNPFNSSTTIKYDLPEKTKVKITIYDILGRRVKVLVDETNDAGYKTIVWKGNNNYGVSIASGLYFYRIETPNFQKTKKLLIIK